MGDRLSHGLAANTQVTRCVDGDRNCGQLVAILPGMERTQPEPPATRRADLRFKTGRMVAPAGAIETSPDGLGESGSRRRSGGATPPRSEGPHGQACGYYDLVGSTP